MKVQRCKGMRDLSPAQMKSFRLIEGAFRDSCLKWGYQEVRTPALEYLHLFTATGTLTPGRLNKVYSFLDWDGWSGERVVLRPDGTIPVARLYVDGMEGKELARLFYVTDVFIFEETGQENRERWQCGAELVGVSSPEADVELIMLSQEILKRLGLKEIRLRLSHAGLIRALLAALGLSGEEQGRVFDQILDGDVAALAGAESARPELGRVLTPLLGLEGRSAGFLKNLKALLPRDLPELEPSLNNFIEIVELLEALGCPYQIDVASGRGFEYYTGVIFRLFVGEEGIGGGGRYDSLISLVGGRDVPASGFALYLDQLMSLTKAGSLAGPEPPAVLVKAGPGAVKKGFAVAARLREAGYVVEYSLGGREPAGVRWTLEVRSEAPPFTVIDRTKRRRFEAQTADEVLAAIGGGGR